MQWDASENAGFTTGTPWIEVGNNYKWLNAEAEVADENSVFAFFKNLIALRKAEKVIQAGDVRFLESPAPQVIAYERELDGERVVVQCNFSGEKQPAIACEGGEVLVSNYDGRTDGPVLRPWEATAIIWR